MQVNSVNSTSFKSLYTDYKERSDDMRNSYDAIKNLKLELMRGREIDGENVKPKNVFGVIASLLFAAGASYFITRKGYNAVTSFLEKVKKDELVAPILNNQKLQNAAMTAKGTLTSAVNVAKNTITEKVPEIIKSNRVVNFLKTNKATTTLQGLNPATKIGLLGAAVGTTAAGSVDGNEDGQADMFQKGISWVDSLASKSNKIMTAIRTLS